MSAPPRRHFQRHQFVKGKSPQGLRVTVQIEQYSLCFAGQLTRCSSPAAKASRLTSSMPPHASLVARQLLKPALKTPRSYGRRHRSRPRTEETATEIDEAAAVAPVMRERVAASGGRVELTKPANWNSMNRTAKKNWKKTRAKHKGDTHS